MSDFSIESLERGIIACKKNIKTFEDAIDKERNTIKEYREMIETIGRKEREHKKMEKIKANLKVEVVRECQ
jgi:hypothetical protein